MEVKPSHRIAVRHAAHAGEARRYAVEVARRAGLDTVAVERAAVVASEMGTNLVKHAGGGELFVGDGPGGGRVELLAVDHGPGIADLERARADGYSTAGSLGAGLGAIARMATDCDVHTVSGAGTVVFAAVGTGAPRSGDPGRLRIGGICVPKPGQTESGDAWAAVYDAERARCVVLVADGLGHGPGAAVAARAAVRRFRTLAGRAPTDVLRAIHDDLRATRGAAVAVVVVCGRLRVVRFAGIGNVSGSIIDDGDARHLVSHHGTAGHEARYVREFEYAWPANAVVVVHSDGIATRCGLERYPALGRRHPLLVAGVLYRDFARGTDDATVVVVGEVP